MCVCDFQLLGRRVLQPAKIARIGTCAHCYYYILYCYICLLALLAAPAATAIPQFVRGAGASCLLAVVVCSTRGIHPVPLVIFHHPPLPIPLQKSNLSTGPAFPHFNLSFPFPSLLLLARPLVPLGERGCCLVPSKENPIPPASIYPYNLSLALCLPASLLLARLTH